MNKILKADYKVLGVGWAPEPKVWLQVFGDMNKNGVAYIGIGFKAVTGDNTLGSLLNWEAV